MRSSSVDVVAGGVWAPAIAADMAKKTVRTLGKGRMCSIMNRTFVTATAKILVFYELN